ncbi:MAG: HAD family hydrolase [Flavobacteriales bacterium]|nr:HAD family hydrolase [Flavobacteriales bacterium]
MKKAVFLDRDGVINQERGDYTWKLEDIVLLTDLIPFLKELQQRSYELIVITNQGGIGKGLYSREEYFMAEQKIAAELDKEGIHFQEVYYCPHHPTVTQCLCRKPGGLLFEKAIARFNIDPKQSYMIGDRERDIEAAASVGIKGFLIEANSPLLPILDKIS